MSIAGVGAKQGADGRGAGAGAFYAVALVGLVAVLSVEVVSGVGLIGATAFVTAAVTLTAAHRTLLNWQSLLTLLVLVIMFVPIRRYTLPGDLPFELEPYRLLLGLMVIVWVTSLLIDSRVRLVATGIEGPLILFGAAILGSVAVNTSRISSVSDEVIKSLTFLISFFILLYFIVSVVKTIATINVLVSILVITGACIGLLSIVESRTGSNPFNRLGDFLPFLQESGFRAEKGRGARLRAYGPAQHPIALGAAMTMILPLALYLAVGMRRRWAWICALLLTAGALATVSRTSVVMLLMMAVILIWLRPQDFKRMAPFVLPLLIAVHFALPTTLGTLRKSFFPDGGLVAEQRSSAGSDVAAGRVADLGPSLGEFSQRPILGEGFGSRIPIGERANARLLDNQWLEMLLETGVVGFFGFAWLITRFLRRVSRLAKSEPAEVGWLLTAISASVGSFALGMFFFDAFAFIQVMFIFFILVAFGICLLRTANSGQKVPP